MRLQWCQELVNLARKLLEEEGWEVRETWYDPDDVDLPEADPKGSHEPTITAWWSDSGLAHVRILMGEDKEHCGERDSTGVEVTSEGRYMFGSIAVQGYGGFHIYSTPDEQGIKSFVAQFLTWRRMATALASGKT